MMGSSMIRATSPKFVIALTDHALSSSHHVNPLEELAARRPRRLAIHRVIIVFTLRLIVIFHLCLPTLVHGQGLAF